MLRIHRKVTRQVLQDEIIVLPTCKLHRSFELKLVRLEAENVIILLLLAVIIALMH